VLNLGREGLVTLRNDDAFRPRDFSADDGVWKVTPSSSRFHELQPLRQPQAFGSGDF